MATKPKAASPPPDEDETDAETEEGAEGKSAGPKKASLLGRVLGPVLALPRLLNPLKILKLPLKQKLIAAAGLLVVLGGAGGGIYFFMSGAEKSETVAAEESVKTQAPNLPVETAAFFDVPDIIVNIQTADSTPAYLKLSVALELEKAESKVAIEPVLPRVIDQFQTYLRELRVEDVRGSTGVMRLKEELLRRVNLAVAPTPVHDVLLKEMIVQ
jgi:flagellar protein FliL